MISFRMFLEAEAKAMDEPEHSGNLAVLADMVRQSDNYQPDGDPYIWRGVRHDVSASVMNPGSGKRSSQNTSNYYTVLFDENPANAGFPKRQNSFICTTNYKIARAYGRTDDDRILAIYPMDEAVAAVNMKDIWDIRLKLRRTAHVDSLPALNTMLADVTGEQYAPDTTEGIISLVRSQDPKSVRREFMDHDFGGISSAARNASDEEFVDMLVADLEDSYNYHDAGMSMESVRDLPSNTEVWFSGKCVVIPVSKLEEFKQLLLKE